MGVAKRMLEEEQSRLYHTSGDAVCASCFDDSGIKKFIEQHVKHKRCSICKRGARKAIAASADGLLEFFLAEVLKHYQNAEGSAPYDSEDGRWLVPTWTMREIVFQELEQIAGQRTLKWLYQQLKDDIVYCKREWQIMTPGEGLAFGWQQFSEAVKHETRFLFFNDGPEEEGPEPFLVSPGRMLEELGEVIVTCGLIRTINRGQKIFRARGHKHGSAFTDPVDLGPPPEKFARSAGRMNAPGIVVMYAAFERDTAIAEATSNGSDLSVATFELLRQVRVVDLTKIPATPSIFGEGPRESLGFLHQFAADVSQPFNPDVEIHIEYTPTQVVSEYLRHRLHDTEGRCVGGVVYDSAKRAGATNIALFVGSEHVEGVHSPWWRTKEPLLTLKLVGAEEVVRS